MKTLRSVQLFLMAGICLSAQLSSIAAIRYVHVNSTNPTPPYTNWATAASVIQDAIDVSLPGDEVVVTNGVYETGGRVVPSGFWPLSRLISRAAVTIPLALRSVNGSEVTVIRGYQVPGTTNGPGAVRGVYLTNGATLTGFTVANGATDFHFGGSQPNGGGVYCEGDAFVSNCLLAENSAAGWGGGAYGGTMSNCAFRSNSANEGGGGASNSTLRNCALTENSARDGGGANGGTLNNCILARNSARIGGGMAGGTLNNCIVTANVAELGGGIVWGTLNNCTITFNSARTGGGAAGTIFDIAIPDPPLVTNFARLNNCILFHNSATEPQTANYTDLSKLNYSCTTPFPSDGVGNITNAPLFVDAAAGNFRLQATSPCINAGHSASAPTGPDFDGNPRIAGGTVDIGAYEFQSPQSTLSYAWLQQYGLPTNGSADFTDLDGDGHNNWQEWHAWTDPTNSASALRLLIPVRTTNGFLISWESVSGQAYVLERSTNIAGPFDTVIIGCGMRFPCPTDCPLHFYSDQPGTLTYRDMSAVGPGPFFYRVTVRE